MTEQDHKLTTGKVRFAFARVFVPEAFAGQAEKYSVRLLIPKDDKAFIKRYEAALAAAKELGKAKKWGDKVPGRMDLPLKDGDEVDLEKYPEHEGHWYINAKSINKPDVLKPNGKDKDGRNILADITDTTEFYSGCYGKARITLWPFAEAGNKGISALLEGVVKTQDGESFSGGGDAKAAFADEDLGQDDDDDDFLS